MISQLPDSEKEGRHCGEGSYGRGSRSAGQSPRGDTGHLNAARGAGTLIPSAQRLVWAAKQALGKAALGALFA